MALNQQGAHADFGFTQIRPDMTLRSMVVRNAAPKGYVLFLHGFPETVYAWKDIALTLGKDYEVHAFDWPGYGQSTRPAADQFSYSPRDYAGVLRDYIRKSGIDSSKLVIYATDIGALPALLLAMDEPKIARSIVVGDFAPFNRPEYMYASLQSLKSLPGAEGTRAYMNKTRDEILANTYRRGLSQDEQFDISKELLQDMSTGWSQGSMSSADAFYNYYLHFTRDQDYLESNLGDLKTPVRVIWGDRDLYIDKQMGAEFSRKAGVQFEILPGIGHYPHLQNPAKTVDEVRSEFGKV
jgi:pimeloyl-ACP methyl ester carboxylesterase